MKLSEAIRKGAAIRPQCFGKAFTFDREEVCSSCALGAAYEVLITGQHGDMDTDSYRLQTFDLAKSLTTVWPELEQFMGSTSYTLGELIWHRNDGTETCTRRHTREEIADWVESLGY